MKNKYQVHKRYAAILLAGLFAGELNAEEPINVETANDRPSNDLFGVGVYGGTTGIGGYVTYEVQEWLYIRGQLGGFSYSMSNEIDGVDYDGDLSLFSGGITANFIPFYKKPVADGFRISLGLFGVDNKLGIVASSPGQSIDIGNANTFTLGSGDRIEGETGLSSLAPYIGLGWDWYFGADDQFILSLDAGVQFVGKPDVSLAATGTFADFAAQNPTLNLQNEIDAEITSIRDDVDKYQYFPLVSLGFMWRY